MPAETTVQPILIVNPRNDEEFVELANALVREVDSTAGALEERLRQRFPKAVVHVRELSGEQLTVWYVYRDGHWTRNGNGYGRPERRTLGSSLDRSAGRHGVETGGDTLGGGPALNGGGHRGRRDGAQGSRGREDSPRA